MALPRVGWHDARVSEDSLLDQLPGLATSTSNRSIVETWARITLPRPNPWGTSTASRVERGLSRRVHAEEEGQTECRELLVAKRGDFGDPASIDAQDVEL